MAEDKDTMQDDDVEGHEAARSDESERPKRPGEAAAVPGDEDDVEGHEATARSAEPGKNDSPGVKI